MKRILITGGQGQLGRALTDCYASSKLSRDRQESGALDQAHSQRLQTPAARAQNLIIIPLDHQELDISVEQSIAHALETYRPDVVINTAAYTAVDRAESEPDKAHLINGAAPDLLAQACAARGVGMLHVSTDYVFDGSAEQPYPEDAPTHPLSVYGQSKLAGEQAVLAALPSAVIVRTSWVFSQFGNNFLKTMLRLGRERSELSIVADQVGGPSYAPHIAQVLLALAEKLIESQQKANGPAAPYGIYHFAGQPDVSWYGFAQEIFAQALRLGLLAQMPSLTAIPTSQYPTPARRPAQSGLSQTRLDALFGSANIERDWRQGIEKSLLSLQDPL